jgi:hypothetical protein
MFFPFIDIVCRRQLDRVRLTKYEVNVYFIPLGHDGWPERQAPGPFFSGMFRYPIGADS